MVHAVSATYLRFERMSPPAAGMALALHLTVALALWWVSPLKFTEPDPEPIEVTMEAPPPKQEPPAPAPQPPPAPQQAAPAPLPPPPPPPAALQHATPAPLGVRPPAPATPDKPTPEKPTAAPPKKEEPQEAVAPPKPEAKPEPPPVEKALPPVEAPPPPLSMQDFVKIAPPPPPQEVVKPLPQRITPPPPQPQPQQPRPSPLSSIPQQRPPDTKSATAPSNTFVNPAETYSTTRVRDAYLWQVAQKISQYRYHARDKVEQGSLVVRMVIARDGRLIDISIVRSSGFTTLDKGVIEAARAASPYPSIPAEITGEAVVFSLPLVFAYRQ